jgi:flagellar assembly protein FliH
MESKDDESAADLEKVREEAEYIIFSAKSEAQIIIENARQKMDEVRKNAAKEAYDKAYEKYAAEAQNTARAVTEKAEALMASAEREHDTATSEVEAQAVDLIIKIVDKLLRNSVKIKPDIILVLVREALRNTSENLSGLDVKLRVSPDDYNLVLQNMDELTYGEKTSDGRIELVMDDSLASMDCVIETPFGSVESSLQGQYESIKTDLTYLLHEGA